MNDPTWSTRRSRRLGILAGVVLASLLMAGCAAGNNSKAPVSKDITIGYTAEDVSLDPNLSIVTSWQSVLSNIYDTVVRRDRKGAVVPSLAKSWSQIDDLTWEIVLRDDVKFHDGTAFSADDVTFTINRVLNEELKSPQRPYISAIAKAESVNPTTVRITTATPFPLLIDNLQLVPIVSSKLVEAKGNSALTKGANGTGPYSLVSWATGGDLVLNGAKDNWRGEPKITKATFRPIPEVGARVSALQAGEIDIAIGIQPESAELIDGTDGLRIEAVRSQRSNYIVLDNKAAPFDNVKVRQALNYAINKESIVKNLLLGHGEILPSLLGSMYRGYNAKLDPYPYDPKKAKSLLAEAGYPNGFSMTFNSSDVRPKDREIAQAITAQLGEVGIKVDNQITEWGAFLDRYKQHDLGPFYIISFGTPVWDFGVAFNSYLLPASPQSYYRDADVEATVKKVATITDPEDRQKALASLNEKLYKDAAFVYLFSYQDLYGVTDRVKWTATSDEKIWLYDASINN